MNSEKVMENKKEDSRAFGKFIVIIIVSALLGGVVGFGSAFLGESQKTLTEIILKGLDVVAPFVPLVLTTIIVIWDIVEEKRCRKLFVGWDGEDELVVDQIEMPLSQILIATKVNLLVVYFFFGATLYCIDMAGAPDKSAAMQAAAKSAFAMAGLIYTTVAVTLIQKRIVNFEKEINPEKKGSVYDAKFQKKWLESCDEGERLQIYKSAYKSYQVTNITCMILWVVTVIGLMTLEMGLLPMTCVLIIWLVLSLSYSLETLRLSKHPSEIMK